MSDDGPKTRLNPAKADARNEREERLNAALRENLKKRKQQGRARSPARGELAEAPDPADSSEG